MDKSRGYCLEMICADFLAGATLDNEDPTMLLQSMSRFFKFLPGEQRQAFLHEMTEKASCTQSGRNSLDFRWSPSCTIDFGNKCYGGMGGGANAAAPDQIWKFTTRNFAARAAMIPSRT